MRSAAAFLMSVAILECAWATEPLVNLQTVYPPSAFTAAPPVNFATGPIAASATMLAVGVREETIDVPGQGAVYIFERAASGWSFRQKIVAPAPQANDRFGQALSISDSWLVVAAPRREATGLNDAEDRLEFFRLANGVWLHDQTVILSRNGPFGAVSDVCLHGDSVVVGRFRDSTLNTEGAVLSLRRNASGWSERQRIQPADVQALDGFGLIVARDQDRFVAVSQRGDSGPNPDIGAAYVFREGPGGEWVEESKLLLTDVSPANLTFRGDAAISGSTVIVGAAVRVSATTFASAAIAFERVGTNWQRTVIFGDLGAIDGQTVWGNIALLSQDRVAISASGYRAEVGGTPTSAVYVYSRNSFGRWGESDFLLPPDALPQGGLGSSIFARNNELLVTEPNGSSGSIAEARGNFRWFGPRSLLPTELFSDGFEP